MALLQDVTVQGPAICLLWWQINLPPLSLSHSLSALLLLSLWQGERVVSRCSTHYYSKVKRVVDPSRLLVSGPRGLVSLRRLTSMETATTARFKCKNDAERVGRFLLLASVCNSGRTSELEKFPLITKRSSKINTILILQSLLSPSHFFTASSAINCDQSFWIQSYLDCELACVLWKLHEVFINLPLHNWTQSEAIANLILNLQKQRRVTRTEMEINTSHD